STPEGRYEAAEASMSPMGWAGLAMVVATVVFALTAPISSTVPHAWHSPQRPTHFTVLQPHSAQR
ncbi:hypothetical protein, partial [Marinobacter sp. BW6]|uniref:hypothetical protein n=1 Tax=Marinobacter sp. BW6 TaxID=2592624 RepID=UPI001F075315